LTLSSGFQKKSLKTSLTLNLKKRVYPAEAYDNLKQSVGALQEAEKMYIMVDYSGGSK